MKKKGIVIAVIILVVGLIGFNIWKNTATTTVKNVTTTTLTEETMQETVMTPGTLKLENEQYIYYQPEKGTVQEIFVEAGDRVKKGDKLVAYDNEQVELEKKQNQLQINSIYLELDQIKNQHEKIDKEVDKDPENDALQEQHDQIYLQQQQLNIDLERTLLEKRSIENRLDDAVVTADAAGTVFSVNEEVANGSQTTDGAMIQIGSLDKVVVEGTISEYDTLNIVVGQNVILTSDAVPDEEWQGEISYIADLPEAPVMEMGQEQASVLYPIKVSVEGEMPLKPGFKMLIEIITSEEAVNTLPISAVQQQDDENFVYILEDGKAKRVPVKIGAVDTEKMEIKDGISEEDQVIIDPSDAITDGTDVTVK